MNYTSEGVKSGFSQNALENSVGKATAGQIQQIINNLWDGNLNYDDTKKKKDNH
jgi:hypothetical protein